MSLVISRGVVLDDGTKSHGIVVPGIMHMRKFHSDDVTFQSQSQALVGISRLSILARHPPFQSHPYRDPANDATPVPVFALLEK